MIILRSEIFFGKVYNFGKFGSKIFRFFMNKATKRKFSNGPIAQIDCIYVNLWKSFFGTKKSCRNFYFKKR